MTTPDRGELIVYRTEDGQAEVRLQTLDGSVWLNQGEMAELFDTTKQNVSLHIKNILKEGELREAATVKESLTTAEDAPGDRRDFRLPRCSHRLKYGVMPSRTRKKRTQIRSTAECQH